MTQERKHLPPFSTINPNDAIDRAFSTSGLDTGFFINDAIRHAISVAAEMMRPSIRKLAERIHISPIHVNGWVMRPVATRYPWNLAFVAENPHLPGGYLFNLKIRREFTEPAAQKYREMEERRYAHVHEIKDPDERQQAWIQVLISKNPEEDNLRADLSNFKAPQDCELLEDLACWAFRDKNGHKPSAMADNQTNSLDELLAGDLDGKNYVGRAFYARSGSDLRRADEGRPRIEDAETGTARFAAIEAMLLLDEAICDAGLKEEVAERARSFRDVEFVNFNSPGYEIPALVAYGSVYADGGRMSLGTVGTIIDFWEKRECVALDRHSDKFVSMVRRLAANGHVTPECRHDSNDLDDWVWVEEASDTAGIVWLETIGTQLRMEYSLDEESDELQFLYIAKTDRKDFEASPAASAAERGFVGVFARTSDGFVADPIGPFTPSTYVALDKAIGAIIRVSHALDEDYGAEADRNPKA